MNVHPVSVTANSGIPVARIAEARRLLPCSTLTFEAEFEADGLETLSDLVLLFARAGLICDALRYCRGGGILARLCDCENSDFRLLDIALAQTPSLRLVRWTMIHSRPADLSVPQHG